MSGMINPPPSMGMQGPAQVHFDVAHGPYPLHADVMSPTDFGCQKLRVDGVGNILSDDLVFSNRFLRDNR